MRSPKRFAIAAAILLTGILAQFGCDRAPASYRNDAPQGDATAQAATPAPTPSQPPIGPIVWTPNPAILDQLDPYEDVDDYEI